MTTTSAEQHAPPTEQRSVPTRHGRVRTISRRVVLAVGMLLVLVSLLAGYAQAVVISSSGFADHATAALDDPGVQTTLSGVIVSRMLQGAPPRLALAEPLLQNAVGTVISSTAFTKVFRAGLTRTHQALLSERSSTVVLNLSRQASLVLGVLAARDPDLARNARIQSASARLRKISQGNALLPLIHALNRVRAIEILAPIGALLCFAVSILLAVNRRRGLRNVGLSIAIPAFIIWLLLAIGQWLGPQVVSAPLSQALPGIWKAFLGDLRRWSMILVLAGLAVAAIANVTRQPPDPRNLGIRSRIWFDALASTPARRLLVGAAAVAVGLLVVFEPLALVRLLVVMVGAGVIYWGVYGALSLLAPQTASPSTTSGADSAGAVGAGRWGAVAILLVATILLWIQHVWLA